MEFEIIKLRQELEDRERDLEKVAKFGQSLLMAKESLENELADLKSNSDQGCSKCYVNTKRIQDQEKAHNDLVIEFENLQSLLSNTEIEKKSSISTNKDLQANLTKLRLEFDCIKSEKIKRDTQVEALLLKNQSLEQDFHTLQEERKISMNKNKSDEIKLIQDKLEAKTVENEMMKIELREKESEIKELNNRIEESEQMVETYQSFKETCEDLECKIDDLEHTIEIIQETNSKLKAKIAILEPDSESTIPTTECKTLFTELEDKRVELQNINVELQEKHAGLEVSHHKALHQQQRMKNHIARLSQLSSAEESQEKMLKLEQALAQAESERSELEDRLDKLQRQGHVILPSEFDEDIITMDDKSRMLEFQVQSLMDEIESLRKSNKMVRLVKTAETGKITNFKTVTA